MANLLTAKTEIQLDRKISRLEINNGSEIAVVTVPETTPSASSKEFATELFNYWGIGKKEINNGVLVLISKSDRRIEIETGYGVRNILSHTFLQKLIDRQIIPNFKQNDFDSGVEVAIDNIILALRKSDFFKIEKINSQQKQNYRETRESFLAVVICFSIASIVSFLAIIFFHITNAESIEPKRKSRIPKDSERQKVLLSDCSSTTYFDSGNHGGGSDFGGGVSGGDGGGGGW